MPSTTHMTNRHAMTILFLTMFIVTVEFGVIMPILPFYAESMGASATDLGMLFAAYSIVPFGLGEAKMAVVFVAMGIVMALTQGLLVGRFINRWGEQRVIQVGLLSSAIGFVLFLATFDMQSMVVVMGTRGLGNAALRPAINSSRRSERRPVNKA